MVVIWSVAIEAITSIPVWGSCVTHRTAANNSISSVDIDIPAIVNIDIRIAAALVHIYPIVI